MSIDRAVLLEVVEQYRDLDRVSFDVFRDWESRLHNDLHDLQRLYSTIMADQAVHEGTTKVLEAGLAGYVKGQQMNVADQIEKTATEDPLTGLKNRSGYEQGLHAAIKRAERENYSKQGRHVAVAFIDVNRFKAANDSYGHKFGDDILRYIGEALQKYTRETDIKSRFGGDEFAIVFDGMRNENLQNFLAEFAHKVNTYVHSRVRSDHPGKKTDVDISVGLTLYKTHSEDMDELKALADKAMYHAKKNPVDTELGRLNFHIYDNSLNYIDKDARKGRD